MGGSTCLHACVYGPGTRPASRGTRYVPFRRWRAELAWLWLCTWDRALAGAAPSANPSAALAIKGLRLEVISLPGIARLRIPHRGVGGGVSLDTPLTTSVGRGWRGGGGGGGDEQLPVTDTATVGRLFLLCVLWTVLLFTAAAVSVGQRDQSLGDIQRGPKVRDSRDQWEHSKNPGSPLTPSQFKPPLHKFIMN